jgi:type IV pilus biogenesis protein PilP
MALCVMLTTVSAYAGQPSSGNARGRAVHSLLAKEATIRQISGLNAQAQVLKAQLEIAKLKAAIRKAQADQASAATAPGNGAKHVSTPSSDRLTGAQNTSRAQRVPSLPKVLSVYGFGDRLTATLLSDGGQVVVRAGDRINGGRILRIRENLVTAKFGGRRVVLSWAYGSGGPRAGFPFARAPGSSFHGTSYE